MVQVICASVATTLAAPEAEADPHYVAYGYVPALYNSYPNWPGVSTPYSSSTCFGQVNKLFNRRRILIKKINYIKYYQKFVHIDNVEHRPL